MILGGAGDIYNSTSMPNYCDGPYIHLGVYINKVLSAWTKVWSSTWPSTASNSYYGSRGSFWADIFEILGGAGDIYNSISMPNY